RSISPQVAKTTNTIVAFNMPPEDARHLQRLQSAFTDLEVEISNAPEFSGVAVSDGRPVLFRSAPVKDDYMTNCVNGSLVSMISSSVTNIAGEPEINQI